jgi:protein-glutamine gamma-glutamyltransferase
MTPPLSPVPETAAPLQRMRWTVTAAGLTALATLYLNSGGLPFLIVIAIGMLLSYMVPVRLGDRTMFRWALRIGLLAMVIVLNQETPSNSDFAIGGARSRNLFGQFYATELLVQCWRQGADPARSRLIALGASAMLMMTASNSFTEQYVLYLAPLYLTFVALSLYDYRPRPGAIRAHALRAVLLFGVLGIGFVSYRFLFENKGQLTELGNRFLGDRLRFEGTGMASQPILGATFGLRGSTARVLRIENPTGDGHLRGMSFDLYENGRWSPSFFERQYRAPVPTDLRPPRAYELGSAVTEMIVTRLVGENPLIYAPLNAAALDRGESEDIEWAADSGGPFRTRVRPPYEYRVTVPEGREEYQGLLATPLDPERRERALQVPERLDPRVAELARAITRGAVNERAKIEAVTTYLISNHSYSLTFTPDGSEPLVSFLLSEPKKSAHCEYFASAAALLLRYVGIPTRYVTGYLAHENAGPGVTIVRQRDAHAWCEAWVEGTGWVTVEATPGDGRPDGDKTPVERWRLAWEWFQDRMEALSEWIGRLTPEQIYLGVVITIGGGIIFGFVRYNQARRRMSRVGPLYSAPDARLADLVTRFERVFAGRGVPFPENRTYAEHLEALRSPADAGEMPPDTAALTEAARQFVRYYEEARFGSRTEEETLRVLTQLIVRSTAKR